MTSCPPSIVTPFLSLVPMPVMPMPCSSTSIACSAKEQQLPTPDLNASITPQPPPLTAVFSPTRHFRSHSLTGMITTMVMEQPVSPWEAPSTDPTGPTHRRARSFVTMDGPFS